ncbi:MAG: S41 family peptidase [Saprospirales bacterium]|nr:S41 family peptidase [Saprospirales bacterium]MBK8490317.1 S41 family peptidase [Saprospirales bacterium]
MKEPAQKNNGSWIIWTPLLLASMLVLGITIGMQLQSPGPVFSFTSDEIPSANGFGHGKLEELMRYIDAKYVDTVDREELIQTAIDHMLEHLDPHSTYLSVDRVREESERLDGNFEGIGVEFMLLEDTIRVIAPVVDGPSEKAGILAGDYIITIEDSLVAGIGMEAGGIIDLLRGPKGSEVRVGILRQPEQELRQVTIVRDQIPMESVDAAYMIDPGIGYIRINRFGATTAQEFNTHVKEMAETGAMKDIIIDLRQNPGGYLRSATDILSQFFPEKNKLLVYTEGRTSQREEWKTHGRVLYDIRNVVVLIDEGSASASEILAGAIQDNDRGIIVGRRSYGKGLVQEQYRMSDGSAIRLTVARYYIPSGRSIQKPYDDRVAYAHDLADRQENGELFFKDSLPSIDTLAYYTTSGRKVYGGGGIYPDVFVPLDSSYQSNVVFQLDAQIPPFVFRRLHVFQQKYKGLTLDQFRRQFQGGEALLNDLISYAKEKGVEVNAQAALSSKEEILGVLKARIAKQLYDNQAYFIVLNERDRDVEKALDILHMANPLSVLE